ncbi:hypothetical protein DL95DRAFT_461955 [Leptodontidium sp. 2 PMI_412]|nr:hypothetical protein DL95DRAFT_461955 [Leptodontidium sp. 2 PMI_412]
MLMAYYMVLGVYKAEFTRDYWSWGILAIVCACAILPPSRLWVRQKFYEFFLLTHIAFSLPFLIGYYYHIWYLYKYNLSYEIWMFVAGEVWGVNCLVQAIRMDLNGSRTALVSSIQDADGDYTRIDIEGKEIKGDVAYLCFTTLSWRFWETHPFSEKSESTAIPAAPVSTPSTCTLSNSNLALATFIARARTRVTNQLSARVFKENGSARIRVLIDGPYHHSGHVSSQLSPCSSIHYIAGGVGIKACLPYLKKTAAQKPAKLFWSNRKSGLETEPRPVLAALANNVQVVTNVGERLDLDAVLSKELVGSNKENDLLGVVVCRPLGMVDDVRQKISEVSQRFLMSRPYVLIEDASSR